MLSDIIGAGSRANVLSVSRLLRSAKTGEVFHASGVLNQNGTRVLRNWFGNTSGPSIMHRLALRR